MGLNLWPGLIFLDLIRARAHSLRVASAPVTSRTRSPFVLSALPAAAAASGTVAAVFAFALKAVVQSTFIYRLRRIAFAALSVRLEYRPSRSALSMVHIRVSECRIHDVRLCAQDRMGAPQKQR